MTEKQNIETHLSLGQRCVVAITDIAFGGEGVARVNEIVIFVPFVTVGEDVEVEITEVKKNFGRAKLLRVLQSSPLRVRPECRYFGECGGCQYQHIAYEAQLEIKRKQVADLFERIGRFPKEIVASAVPCPQPYGYRNRIMIRSQWNKPEQKLNIGFIRHDCGLVVDLEECKIAEPALSEQIKHVRAHPPPKGGLKVVLRVAPEGWEVPKDSFFQNNFFLLPKLVETVQDCLRGCGVKHLIDAYCGVGFFGIEMAGVVQSFIGVELDAQAIKAARRNAAARSVTNGEFIQGATEALLPMLLQRFDPAQTAIVLDPPRTGCRASVIELLRKARPAQIIYVSCHPATLARDLSLLCADGAFHLAKVTPLDMFPQTQHVECVADARLAPA